MTYVKDHRHIIGSIGETAVERLLFATRSEDWYDSKKDGIIGHMTYEVKTFRLNGKTKGFWLGENKSLTMWNKVDNVDMLFFIKVPENADELANLYLCIDHKNCWNLTRRNDNTPIRTYPINKCLFLSSLNEEESKIIYENSMSISVHKRNVNNV
jgi:hypothetical protein